MNEFRPARWLTADGTYHRESPYKNPVFWAGQRQCLGIDMAQLEVGLSAVKMKRKKKRKEKKRKKERRRRRRKEKKKKKKGGGGGAKKKGGKRING